MDTLDKKLLGILQDSFPVTERPYLEIASQLGIIEEEAIDRVKALKAAGVIRAINAIFEPKHLGLKSALFAAKVEPDKLDTVAGEVNNFCEVTHNYARDNEYNLWFTVMAGSNERLNAISEKISKLLGVKVIQMLPAIKKYKLNVNFEMQDGQSEQDDN